MKKDFDGKTDKRLENESQQKVIGHIYSVLTRKGKDSRYYFKSRDISGPLGLTPKKLGDALFYISDIAKQNPVHAGNGAGIVVEPYSSSPPKTWVARMA